MKVSYVALAYAESTPKVFSAIETTPCKLYVRGLVVLHLVGHAALSVVTDVLQ